MAGVFFDLDRTRGQTISCGLRSIPHGRIGFAQAPPFESRVDNAALALPCRAVGQEHRLAQQRPQPFAHTVRFGKIHRAIFKHRLNQLWLVHQIAAKERRAEFGHPGAVKPFRLRRKNVLPEQLQITPQRHPARTAGRFGRDHAATEVYFETGTSMREREARRPAYRVPSDTGPAVIWK